MIQRIKKNQRAALLTSPTHTFSDLKDLNRSQLEELFLLEKLERVVIHDSKSTGKEEKQRLVEATHAVGIELIFVDSDTEKREVAKEILDEIMRVGPSYFCEFCLSLTKSVWREEWDQFIIGHEVSSSVEDYTSLHYWDNLGVGQDPKLQVEIIGFLSRPEMTQILENLSGLIPDLTPHKNMDGEPEVNWALLLSMLSNAVRGLLYWSMGAKQSYSPRVLAIQMYGDHWG